MIAFYQGLYIVASDKETAGPVQGLLFYIRSVYFEEAKAA
jgi:hypothetical protein